MRTIECGRQNADRWMIKSLRGEINLRPFLTVLLINQAILQTGRNPIIFIQSQNRFKTFLRPAGRIPKTKLKLKILDRIVTDKTFHL